MIKRGTSDSFLQIAYHKGNWKKEILRDQISVTQMIGLRFKKFFLSYTLYGFFAYHSMDSQWPYGFIKAKPAPKKTWHRENM